MIPTSDNIPFLLPLHGKLDVRALSQAVRDVVRWHESPRTILVVINVKPADVDAAVAEAATHRRELSADAPRAYLFRSDQEEHVLLLIAADRASMLPLARDLEAAYATHLRSAAPERLELPVPC